MEPSRRAVIDVGTNSIKLLVADVAGNDVQPVWEESRQTRLGRGFYATHRLNPESIASAAKVAAEFTAAARRHEAASVRIIATSAARDAVNPQELTCAIEQACGLKVDILSGDMEADWVFEGVRTDPAFARAPLLLLDVGGGSTEFILGRGAQKHFRRSFALGSVRLLETLAPSDPPKPQELTACRRWLKEFLAKEVAPQLDAPLRREMESDSAGGTFQLVGTGGAASILACMEAKLDAFDRSRIEATRLDIERVHWHLEHIWGLSLEQRKLIPGLPKNRADVILMGVAIYAAIMEQLSCRLLRISTRGLRFAAVLYRRSEPQHAGSVEKM